MRGFRRMDPSAGLPGLSGDAQSRPYPMGVAEVALTPGRHPGPLRVVVVVDDPVVPAAVARTIDRVAGAPVDLLRVDVRPRLPYSRSRFDVTALVDRADRALFRPAPDALAPVDLRRFRADVLAVTSQAAPGDDGGLPDVVLDLTATGLSPGDGDSPPLGVWSLRYGRDQRRFGAANFVPEYLSEADAGVCELVAEVPTPAESSERGAAGLRVIYRSVSAVDRHSPARTRNEAAWKSAEFPARVLAAVATDGPAAMTGRPPHRPEGLEVPRSRSVAPLVRLLLGRGLREAVRRLAGRPRWFVAVRVGRAGTAAEPGFDTRGFRPLVPPSGRFYADPFVVRRPEGAYVFVEDGPVDGGPARISVVALDANGEQRSTPRVVLERPSHLSYPFVFQDDGDWYMLPETAGTRTVELLRAREFPWQWEPCCVLLRDVRAWDPTLLRHDGVYWLFVNMAAPGARPSDELCLYSAAALTGPWRPHPMNPVVSDARRARPAGRILMDGGSLIRPAQDASGGYGRRIILNRIDVLTHVEYRETPVGSIEPGWLPGVVRTHTYTAECGFEVLDGVRYERRSWGGRRVNRMDVDRAASSDTGQRRTQRSCRSLERGR